MTTILETKYLNDYQLPPFLIKKTSLRFLLDKGVTTVESTLLIEKNPLANIEHNDLVLDGECLTLQSVAINGENLQASDYQLDKESLCINSIPDRCTINIVVDIEPEKNTSLEGLYHSRSMYCTQCEAEGFRKITYYLDRPDVMSEFEVTLVANQHDFKTMLSNGNCIADKIIDGRREVTWHDPHLKPCYLFALVAGNLQSIDDHFITSSGREVLLQIFVEEKDLDKCAHAMDSLKRAMQWDEENYGREYDLDIFMIVAVDDFNMGAMENKGLNIFNTSCILAHPATTTDAGFERVEAVVAHEYFHNWSGNRVTCRDWFQLSLKEGFTVYRDAEFSADMNSRAVKRIEDVNFLRNIQFAEDAGPMAHAVRPESFIEISNFYTVTIYEKGAEVVRMMANILGPELFRQATDLYFQRHDGQAVSCEDFVVAMEDASGIDLTQFRLWYSQAGTPVLQCSDHYDAQTATYTLTVKQKLRKTAECKNKQAQHIPLRIGLLGEAGALALHIKSQQNTETQDNTDLVLPVRQMQQSFVFENIHEQPTPSLLRGFSAPVIIEYNYTNAQLAMLISSDSDGFSRWDAAQQLMVRLVKSAMKKPISSSDASLSLLLSAFEFSLDCDIEDPSMLALLLTLPSQQYIADSIDQVDPSAVKQAHHTIRATIANALADVMKAKYLRLLDDEYTQSHQAKAWRSLKNVLLAYLAYSDQAGIDQLCFAQFESANNMTDQLAALKCLLNARSASALADKALNDFYTQWQHESLVVNMWFQLQASADHDLALSHVKKLLQHPQFEYSNPNKVRALIAGFSSANFSQFHAIDGSGYAFLADQVIHLDTLNPQIASRLVGPLTKWRGIEAVRAKLMCEQLQRIRNVDPLSKDVYEVLSKSLAE